MTALVAVVVGVLMAAEAPDLTARFQTASGDKAIVPSETVLVVLCLKVMQASDFGYWLVVMIFSAIFAAVMSTADSAMLSISSMVTKDLYGPYLNPEAGQAHLTRVGRWVTWGLMVPIVWGAVSYEGTLIQLL
ncbi:MAG: hypothetical protein GWM98_00755, partial [Nitrospinaceae bacterium]|nr:hypothetical protein [Nitrospinaceae bacterium]NIT80504.1 hypothetical protein [Nitrospinaceae bacterium]NIU42832.1 hypothetical protein [Nitrospinaceae bacterium]NIU94903.1 hypothetical protein [Nitrospinaceae bacterium]NIW57606.1 hypothetical protein [Nitrospinaceae bacterium]